MSEYVLEIRDVTKRFPGVIALNRVQFKLRKGEIHALMGENGAGKSTLIKIITGVYQPDEGQVFLNGEEVYFQNTRDSAAKSVAAIYQHSTIYPYLTVTENIFIGHEKMRLGFICWNDMYKRAKELLNNLGSSINPKSLMGNLSVAEQQVVEIAKAVSTNAQILIMDEPTSALSKRECEELYRITNKLKSEGKSIIFISHRLEDIYNLADRVTVFRDGCYIDTWDLCDVSDEKLVIAMVGREIKQLFPKRKVPIGKIVLKVKNLSKIGYFRNVSFDVRRGEIFGLSGLVGSGRSEVCQAICGITRADFGEVILNEKTCNFRHPSESIKKSLGYLPEDRQLQGLILNWEIFKNQTLSTLEKYSDIKGINVSKECEQSAFLCEKLSVKAGSVFDKVSSLSGGNQQKVILSKLLDSELKILIMDEPTKGIDVGAKAQIYGIMSDLVERGYAIVLVSSEMSEVLAMCDRVGIMCEGELKKIFDIDQVTQEEMLEVAMSSSSCVLKKEEVKA